MKDYKIEEMVWWARKLEADIVVFGHTHVQYGRKIELSSEKGKLCYVRSPFLVRLVSFEIPAYNIGGYPTYLAPVRAIFFNSHLAGEILFLH